MNEVNIPYNDLGGEIEVSPYHLNNFIEAMTYNDIKIEAEDAQAKKRLENTRVPLPLEPIENPEMPEFKEQPFQTQKEAVMYGLEKERMLLADIMGEGKTASAMYLAEYVRAHYDFKHILVINGVYDNQYNWEKEIENFIYADSHILGAREKRDGGRRIGGSKEKLEDLSEGIDATYIITNIASVRNKKIFDKLEEMVYNRDIGFLVVDEIHYCIGGKSQQGKNLQKLRPRFRLGMSGSPFNDPMDMYNIESWLGTTYLGAYDYKMQYGTEMITDKSRMIAASTRRMPFPEYFFNDPEKFRKDISRFMLRRTNVLKGLPTIRFSDYLVELGTAQRKKYNEMSEVKKIDLSIFSLDQLEEELGGSQYMNERQVMSSPHVFEVEEDVKLEAVKTLLREIIDNNKTAIIYGFFIETMRKYAEELEKEFPGLGNYVTDRTDDVFQVIEDFQGGRGNFIVGGVKKIGTGFNITRADYVIYADRPATWNDFEQSYMRAWRRGRTSPVHVIKILCVDTWDDKMSWNLQERKNQSDSVLGANQTAENVIDGRYE